MMNHKYFSISELCYSNIAMKNNIKNVASVEIENNLDALIIKILDPLRIAMGKPITVTSGYRCKKLNDKIKGSKTSSHLKGNAADITIGNEYSNRIMAKYIAQHFTFDQLLIENGFKWIHISYCNEKNRNQIMKYEKGIYKKIEKNKI